MKKVLFSALAVLTLVSLVSAAPRFGIAGALSSGIRTDMTNGNTFTPAANGLFLTADNYNASLLYASTYTDSTNDIGTVYISANYKQALNNMSALTFGVAYTDVQSNGVSADTHRLDLNIGIEKMVNANIVLTAQGALYSSGKASDVEYTQYLSNAQIGVAYLF